MEKSQNDFSSHFAMPRSGIMGVIMSKSTIQWLFGKLGYEYRMNKGNYFFQGATKAVLYDKSEYVLFYGAIDQDVGIAKQKAISELCERITWFELNNINKDIFVSTSGFSSHNSESHGALNSILEYYERIMFNYIIDLINDNNLQQIMDEFYVDCIKEGLIIYQWNIRYNICFVLYMKRCKFNIDDETKQGILIGIGRESTKESAISMAYNEIQMLKKFTYNIYSRRVEENDSINMQVEYLRGVFMSKTMIDMYSKLHEMCRNRPVKIAPIFGERCYTFDVSEYCPQILSPLNRKVYYTCNKIIRDDIINSSIFKKNRIVFLI